MDDKKIEVTLEEILDAKERRADRQRIMLECNGGCIISFTLNIPGPVKINPLIQESFDEGLCQIETKLNEAGIHIIQKEQRTEKTGCEALLSVAHDAMELKRMMVEIEEQHPLGRVFDIDVISGEGCPISRSQLGYPPRRCPICGRIAHECARTGRHDYKELLDTWYRPNSVE